MRQFIYINKRSKPLEKWKDISCKTLNFTVTIISVAILIFLVSLILKCLV